MAEFLFPVSTQRGILPPHEDGGQFYWVLGGLQFSLTSGGLSQMGGVKVSTFFSEGGGRGGGGEDKVC